MTFLSGKMYEGQWKDSKFDGEGIIYSNGNKYEG